MMLGYLAESYHRAGQHAQALASVNAGLALSQGTGQMQWDAELHRIKGEFMLRGQESEDEVEQLFRSALEIARKQQAKSLELRAALSLGRLWKQQGELERAHALIAPVYAEFTEGFETPDLVEARALLEDLDA